MAPHTNTSSDLSPVIYIDSDDRRPVAKFYIVFPAFHEEYNLNTIILEKIHRKEQY
jgi:hypothetical protein